MLNLIRSKITVEEPETERRKKERFIDDKNLNWLLNELKTQGALNYKGDGVAPKQGEDPVRTWSIMRFREDKTRPNAQSTAISVFKSIMRPVLAQDLVAVWVE